MQSTDNLSVLDRAIQAQVPLEYAPIKSPYIPLQTNGRRYVLAKDGLYLEYKTEWLHILKRVSVMEGLHQSPFGEITEFCKIHNTQSLMKAVSLFAIQSKGDEIERGAYVMFDKNTAKYLTTELVALDSGQSHLRYQSAPLQENHLLVGDIHTHGFSDSFFSPTDNADDAKGYKMAFVIGNLDKEKFTTKARICLGGVFCYEQSLDLNPITC